MKNLFKNKKGFTLVECVVALLLFSIITASVFTVFSTSRNQIKTQNKNHKLDLLSTNLVSAYEASENFADFSRIVNSNLGINIGSPTPRVDTVALGGGSGAGSIPVAVPYSKISVNDGKAEFLDAEDSPVISFDGNYKRNVLKEGNNGDIPSGKYDKKNVAKMVICGGIRQKMSQIPNNYKITFYKDERTGEKGIKFQVQNKSKDAFIGIFDKTDKSDGWNLFEVNTLSDFEEYLLDNAYYLKCLDTGTHKVQIGTEMKKNGGHWEGTSIFNRKWVDDYIEVPVYSSPYQDYYFQVYDGSAAGDDSTSSTPVTVDGKNLYYCISFNSDDESSVIKCPTQITDVARGDGNPEKMMFDLSKATVTFATASSCPEFDGFKNELKNTNNASFTGTWHFASWIFYRSLENEYLLDSRHLPDARNSMFSLRKIDEKDNKRDGYETYNEYIPKTDAYKSIYYTLQKDNKVTLMNTDGDWMFSFDGTDETNPLKEPTCIFEDIKITKSYKSDEWTLFYQKGGMPKKQIKNIKFENNVATVYDTENKAFIRFIYKNGKFDADKNSVASGEYAKYFTFSGNTATIKDDYKGDIYFSSQKFEGEYSITTQDEVNRPIFVSHAGDFEIIDATTDTELSYGIVGQQSGGTVESETYYITCGVDGIDKKLIVEVTFTNLAKAKKGDDDSFIEPRMYIWTINGNKITATDFDSLQALSKSSSAKMEHTFRKG